MKHCNIVGNIPQSSLSAQGNHCIYTYILVQYRNVRVHHIMSCSLFFSRLWHSCSADSDSAHEEEVIHRYSILDGPGGMELNPHIHVHVYTAYPGLPACTTLIQCIYVCCTVFSLKEEREMLLPPIDLSPLLSLIQN